MASSPTNEFTVDATERFLRRILPAHGPYFPYSKGLQPRGGCRTLRQTAQWLVAQKTDCHISLASFENRRGGRFRATKSFWADVDCGPGKPYPDQVSAYAAIDDSVMRGLPAPLVLNSGNGLHLIWTLLGEMDGEAAKRRAHGLRAAIVQLGLEADLQRTGDYANGPRIPGSINGKNNSLVAMGRRSNSVWTGEAWDRRIGEIEALSTRCGPLQRTAGGGTLGSCHPPASTGADGDSKRLRVFQGAGALERRIAAKTPLVYEGPEHEFDAERIADQCLQMRALREGTPLPNPVWVSLLGVLNHCRDGEKLAHEWSAKDQRYNQAETQGKLDYASGRGYRPVTCAWFRANGRGYADINPCDGCSQSVKSPIALGRIDASTAVVDHTRDGGSGSGAEAWASGDNAFVPPVLPQGYKLIQGDICRIDEEKDVAIRVCQEVYCVRHSDDGDKKQFTWAYRTRKGWNEITLSASQSIPTNPEFADRIQVGNAKAAEAYMTAAKFLVRKQRVADEIKTSFGWNDDRTEFLLGSTVFKQGREEHAPSLSLAAADLARGLRAGGDVGTWRHSMEKFFEPGREASAFLVLLSAGTPLHALMSDEGGAIVVLRSHGSGHGKTTALAAAASIWGRWQDIGNWSNSTRISNSGKWEVAGNLPVPWDEANVADNEDFKQRVLAFADGAPRVRTTTSGVQRVNGKRWSTFLLATSNSDLRSRLGTMAGATEGPVARMFQLETELARKAAQEDGGALLTSFSRHFGHAGPEIIRQIMARPIETLEEDLMRRNKERMARLKLPSSARFACRAITCAEVGGELLKKRFFPDLDVRGIIMTVEMMLVAQVENDAEGARGNDLVGQFIRAKVGELILAGPGMKEGPLRAISGRYEVDRDGVGKLSVPSGVWLKWAAGFNKSAAEAERDARFAGHDVRREVVNLSAGTGYPSEGRTRCIVFILGAETGAWAKEEVTKVVPISRGRRR